MAKKQVLDEEGEPTGETYRPEPPYKTTDLCKQISCLTINSTWDFHTALVLEASTDWGSSWVIVNATQIFLITRKYKIFPLKSLLIWQDSFTTGGQKKGATTCLQSRDYFNRSTLTRLYLLWIQFGTLIGSCSFPIYINGQKMARGSRRSRIIDTVRCNCHKREGGNRNV